VLTRTDRTLCRQKTFHDNRLPAQIDRSHRDGARCCAVTSSARTFREHPSRPVTLRACESFHHRDFPSDLILRSFGAGPLGLRQSVSKDGAARISRRGSAPGRPRASRRIAARWSWREFECVSRCDAPQHEAGEEARTQQQHAERFTSPEARAPTMPVVCGQTPKQRRRFTGASELVKKSRGGQKNHAL